MSNTSKKHFSENALQLFWAPLIAEIKNAKSEKNIKRVLEKYLTNEERAILEKRLGVAYFLSRGVTYRKIREEIDVTDKTISFIKKGFPKRIRKPSMGGRARMSSFPARRAKGFRTPAYKGRKGPRWPHLLQ